jgi:sigma-B regulation protein RsbU (phosphoserine phosphatase)
LGAIDGMEYHDFSLQLNPGDSLVLFTDGVTEATNTSFEEFGEQRLEDTLKDVVLHNCQEIIDAIKADVATFVGEAEQSDDITILAIKRL